MRTKIINYGFDHDILGLSLASYDDHDSDKCQGVYRQEEMLRFIRIVTEHFLTHKQRYYYFQHIVYGRRVDDLAKSNGTSIANVYKHIKKANRIILNIKEIMEIAGGKKSIFVLFQQFVQCMTIKEQKIINSYYVDVMTIGEIAEKMEKDKDDIYRVFSYARNRLLSDMTKDDLRMIRQHFLKQKKSKGA